MAFFKIKAGDSIYELDKLTLGDARVLKRDFGLVNMEHFDPGDPDQLVGLLALAISKTDGISIKDATRQAEDIGFEDFEPQAVDEDQEPDPTPAADAATVEPLKSGKSGKRQKPPGDLS